MRRLQRNTPRTHIDQGVYTFLLIVGFLLVIFLLLFLSSLDAPYYANYIQGGV